MEVGKAKLVFGLLFASLLVSATCGQDFTSSIDNIISKHYNNAVKKGLFNFEKLSHSVNIADKHPFTYNCIHDQLQNPNNNRSVEAVFKRVMEKRRSVPVEEIEEFAETNQKRADFAPIRFFPNLDYIQNSQSDPRACYSTGSTVTLATSSGDRSYTCTSQDVLSTSLSTALRESIVPALLDVFNNMINVQATSGNLKLDSVFYNDNPECTEDFPIPQSYVTQGVANADYVVFVTARPAEDSGTVAYAGPCNVQVTGRNSLGRPLAGVINFVPRYFQEFAATSYTEFDFNKAVKVAIHEMTHALGFSNAFYQYYKDSRTGDYYSPDIAFTETVSGVSAAGAPYNKQLAKLRAPRALDYAQQHFSCPSLDGIELEDAGGAGTAGSHWEKRVVGDEYMAGFVNPIMPISGLTLSLFEDMGYYTVNYDKAEYWGWGKGAGCGFVQDRCERSWPAAGYWCQPSRQLSCSADRKSKGICFVGEYTQQISPYYQHYPDPTVGGTDQAADFCTYVAPQDDGGGYYCSDPSFANEADTSIGEEIGKPNSLCFPVGSGGANGISCYQYKCASDSQLQVYVSGTWFDCPTDGGSVNVGSVISGLTVRCPVGTFVCGKITSNPGSPAVSLTPQFALLFVAAIATVFAALF